MPRRKVVNLNLETVNPIIKKKCRNYTIFCEKMGRGASNWVAEWNRKGKDGTPAPKNLPSPKEAVKMCILLGVEPEEILTEPADIELVNGLLEKERAENAKKERPAISETLDQETQNKLFRQMVSDTNDLGVLLEMLDAINKKMQELR